MRLCSMWKPYASNLPMMRSGGIQSEAWDRSVNSAPKAPLLSTFFFHFSMALANTVDHYNPCENHIDI